MPRGHRRRRVDRSSWSNPLEFAPRKPPLVEEAPAAAILERPSCDGAAASSAADEIPNVAYQAWIGGGKLMFAKLLSVLSVHAVMKPKRHYLLYDEEPRDAPEWRCACKLATCTLVTLRSEIFGRPLDVGVDKSDRYASDRLGRCANAQLDLLRIDTLLQAAGGGEGGGGGVFFDLDVFILRPLEPWRRTCAGHSAVLGRDGFGAPNSGCLLAPPRSSFLGRWRDAYQNYRADEFDFGRCNVTARLADEAGARERRRVAHLAPELGPLPRYASRRAYDEHLDHAPLAHVSAFRHAWRLHDIMNARHLERIWQRVRQHLNETPAADDPQIRECVAQIAGACWARPVGKCGIYGA